MLIQTRIRNWSFVKPEIRGFRKRNPGLQTPTDDRSHYVTDRLYSRYRTDIGAKQIK